MANNIQLNQILNQLDQLSGQITEILDQQLESEVLFELVDKQKSLFEQLFALDADVLKQQYNEIEKLITCFEQQKALAIKHKDELKDKLSHAFKVKKAINIYRAI